MRARILLALLLLSAGLVYALARAQNRATPETPPRREAEIREASAGYAEAFTRGDLAALMALWEPDGEYIDNTGKVTKGRAALKAFLEKALAENKGCKVEITTASVRFLSDDIALQDGTARVTHADGEADAGSFNAIWQKKDGKWHLQLVRDLVNESVAPPDAPHAKLEALGWLVGDWTHEDKEVKTTLTGSWMRGKKFLSLTYTVHVKGEEVLSLTQIVGWDPSADAIHSWIFDSRGGFGEGAWTRRGNTWTEEVSGVTASGESGSCSSTWTHTTENAFTYASFDRDIGGNRLPDVTITYQRARPAK